MEGTLVGGGCERGGQPETLDKPCTKERNIGVLGILIPKDRINVQKLPPEPAPCLVNSRLQPGCSTRSILVGIRVWGSGRTYDDKGAHAVRSGPIRGITDWVRAPQTARPEPLNHQTPAANAFTKPTTKPALAKFPAKTKLLTLYPEMPISSGFHKLRLVGFRTL